MPKQITCPTRIYHPQAKVPDRKDPKAAGYDIYCVAGVEGCPPAIDHETEVQQLKWERMAARGYVDLKPGESFIFRTGFAQAIEPGHCCLLWDRSGMGAKRNVHRLAGVIDESYRGEWLVALINHSASIQRINVGDRIVQGLYTERIEAEFPLVDDLDTTERGTDGFGSTERYESMQFQASPAYPATAGQQDEPVVTPGGMADGLGAYLVSAAAVDDIGGSSMALDDTEVTVPTSPEPGIWLRQHYDGQHIANVLHALRDGQPATAVAWMARDQEAFPEGTPKIDPTSLRVGRDHSSVTFLHYKD